MAKKRVTRKRVNDPTVNEALRDIYDKIDGLQPNSSDYITPTPPEEGDTTVVTDEDGNATSAMYTGNEWLVDINANFQPVGTSRGWKSALGASGRSRIPIFNEAIRYDRNNNIPIVNSKKQKVNLSNNDGALAVSGDTLKIGTDGTGLTLKNTSGVLHVRNEADSADAIVNSKYIKLTGEDTAVENSIGLNSTFGPIIRAPGMALDGASIPALTNGFNQACNVEDESSNIVLTAANASLTVGQVVSGTGIPTSGKVCYVGVKAGDNASFTLYRDGIEVNADDDATGTTIKFNNFGMAKFVEMSAGAPSFIQYQTSVTTTPNCWGIGVDPYESPASALASGRPDDAPFIISYNGGSPLTSDTFHSARKLVIDASGVVNFLGDIKLHATSSDDGEVATIGVADSTGILTIATTASDDTYADIILNAGGDIELNADTGIITFKDDGTILGLFSSGVFNLRGNLELRSTSGEVTTFSVADTTGILTIATAQNDGSNTADIVLDPDGDVLITAVTEIKSDNPLKIKEAASAVSNTAAYGQLWVKNEAPNELYFQDDAGTDKRLDTKLIIIQSAFSYRMQSNDQHYGGSPNYFSQSTDLTGTISDGATDTSASAVYSLQYGRMMPYTGNIVKISGQCMINLSVGEQATITTHFWKMAAPVASGSVLAAATIDHIGSIAWDPAASASGGDQTTGAGDDSSYIYAAKNATLDATAAAFNAGEYLIITASKDDGTDRDYIYINSTVVFEVPAY